MQYVLEIPRMALHLLLLSDFNDMSKDNPIITDLNQITDQHITDRINMISQKRFLHPKGGPFIIPTYPWTSTP